MRVLVTGGAGYIGSVVSAELLAAGHAVLIVDDLSTGHADAVPTGAEFVHLGITEVSPILESWRPDAVIHFAAKSLVGDSVADPSLYWQNNVVGTIKLLEAMRGAGVATIVFSSSAATYGLAETQPITEDAPTRPTSPYGASKLAIDLALTDFAHAYGIVAVSLRYFNVAGALRAEDGRWYGERHATETHLIPNALKAVMGAGGSAPMKLFGTDYPTPDGTCVRDYIHVVDLADAHIRALAAAKPGVHEIVNLGSGTGNSVREVLSAVAEVTGCEVPVEEAPRRAGDPPVLIASNAKAAELLGWQPERSLRQMVEDAHAFVK
jgi:UDP-glucose 4-epimerase